MAYYLIIIPCLVAVVAGCIVVPLPPGMAVYSSEYEIKQLVDSGASRDDIITKLGRPTRQYGSDISYRACRKGAGYYIEIYPGGGDVTRSETKCYELILHFNRNDRLTSYEKHRLDPPFTAQLKTPHGDLLPYLRSMAKKGFPESQWRLYDEYGRKPEDIIWLCRSADNGYAKAQLSVGRLYLLAPSIPDYKIKAYMWYRHAATGDTLQALLPDELAQKSAVTLMHETEKALTPEQLTEANALYADWLPGQCELELVQEIDGN